MATRALSSEDFRAQLYHSLQGRGILDSMKSQLRNRLVTELKKSLGGSGISSTPSETVRKSLHIQIADSIVAEYLKCAGYEYSLSIFLPEAGASMDNLCSEEDLFRYLRISPASDLYHHLKLHPQKPGDFLERLLEALIECQDSGVTQPPTVHSVTPQQVPPESPTSHHTSPAKKSVADRLEELDISYARRAEEESMKCRSSVEDRLSAFQCDLEARYKQQLETELGLYRSKELARARQEERERYREELAKEKSDLHHAHQLKLEDVKKSEQRMMEKYRRKEQELEAGIYSQRQTLLGELNSLRVKEAGIKRELELDRRTVALEKEQMKALTEQLESNMKIMKTRFEKMAEEKLQKAKVESELQLQSGSAELAKMEAQLKLDAESIESLKLENKELLAELNGQRKLLQTQAGENASRAIGALQQSEETLGQFSDHKKKVMELRQQLSSSESRCSELKSVQKHQQSTIKQLQAKLSKPSLELVSLQEEVERLHKAHHKELLVLEYDNKQLGRQLAAQTEQTIHSQKRLDEQLVQLRSAQREVQDLHFMLERSQPSVGHGSHQPPVGHGSQKILCGKAKLSKSTPSSSKKISQSTRLPSAQHQTQHSKISTPPPISYHVAPLFREDLTSTRGFDQRNEKSVSFFDSSGMFLAESRATIERMEKEAQQLERNYFDFNYHTLSNSHEVSSQVPPSLLPGPSPYDASFPSPFEPSSISTSATPTNLVRTNPTFHLPLPASGMGETRPRTDFLTSPELYAAPPVIPIPPPASDPVNSIPPPTSDPVNSVPPPGHPVIPMLPLAFDLDLSLPPDPVPKIDTSTAAVLPTSSSLTHVPRHTTPATSHGTKLPPCVTEANSLAATTAVSSLPGLSFTLRTPVPEPVRTTLSTELSSAGNTTVFPKSTMSLDSWWNAPSGESVKFSSTQIPTAGSRVESGDGLPTVSSPELTVSVPTVISSSPAVTRLTGATQTPVTSIALRTSKEPSGSMLKNGFGTRITALRTSEEQSGGSLRNGFGTRITALRTSEEQGGSLRNGSEGERMLEPRAATVDHFQQLIMADTLTNQETVAELKRDDSDEDSIDPVMLKYMQLVTEKRQDKDAQHLQAQSGESRTKEFDVPPLSHDASSFEGFSNHEDAFEDW